MLDFLRLPNIQTTNIKEDKGRLWVDAESITPTFICCLDPDIRPNGTDRRTINDTPHGGMPVFINLKVRRGICKNCGKSGIREFFECIKLSTKMTIRLFNMIASDAIRHNTVHIDIAHDTGISRRNSNRIANRFIDENVDRKHRETPRVIGFDEKKLRGAYRGIVGNIEQRTVLDLLPDRTKSLAGFLRRLPDIEKVEVVCIDQYDGFRRMALTAFPGRAIVTDKFHVVRRAGTALDILRGDVVKRVRNEDPKAATKLRMSKTLFHLRASDLTENQHKAIVKWGQLFPILSKAYWAKERFFDMYDECDTPHAAESYYKRWYWTLDDEIKEKFRDFTTFRKEWSRHVFAYFDHPYTTGYVEAINRTLKKLQYISPAIQFETIRGKLLLAEKLEERTFRGGWNRNRTAKAIALENPNGPMLWGASITQVEHALRQHFFESDEGLEWLP